MKLELKHVVGYLPYKLKMISYNDFVSPSIRELRVDGFQFMIDTRKPILRPLSDLIKEIEINGEKIVPIIELAKLTHIKDNHIAEISQSVKGECDGVKYSFGFYNGSFWMRRLRGKKWVVNDVFSQDELFEKLDEWHFDWRYDLIKNELAIDINTL